MSANAKKSMVSTVALVIFGLIALFIGMKSLVILIPAAIMVWYGVKPTLGSDRN